MILKRFIELFLFSINVFTLHGTQITTLFVSHCSIENRYLEVERILFLHVNTTFHAVHKTCNKITGASRKEILQEVMY